MASLPFDSTGSFAEHKTHDDYANDDRCSHWYKSFGIYQPVHCKNLQDCMKHHLKLTRSQQSMGQPYVVDNQVAVLMQTSAGDRMCMDCDTIHPIIIIQRIGVRYPGQGVGTLFVRELIAYVGEHNAGVMLQACLRQGMRLAERIPMKPDTACNYYGCTLGQKEVANSPLVRTLDARSGSRKRPRQEQPKDQSFAKVRTRSQTTSMSKRQKPTPTRRTRSSHVKVTETDPE